MALTGCKYSMGCPSGRATVTYRPRFPAVEGLSIGEITRRLNREGVPTCKASRWERSVVWGVLRNPAYRGVACFGKTHISARTRVMRPQRRRGVTMPSTTASHERPREEWMEIPVPAHDVFLVRGSTVQNLIYLRGSTESRCRGSGRISKQSILCPL